MQMWWAGSNTEIPTPGLKMQGFKSGFIWSLPFKHDRSPVSPFSKHYLNPKCCMSSHLLPLLVFVSLHLSLSCCVNSVFVSKHFSSIRADSCSKCLLKIKIVCQTKAIPLLCLFEWIRKRKDDGGRQWETGRERCREREKLRATI